MKTPREILFERHRGAEARLDLVRQRALATLAKESNAQARSADFQSAVSQVFNLLARRLSRRPVHCAAHKDEGRPADSKSAIQQIENLSYERLWTMVLSIRWHLAGLSAIWLLVALLNIGRPDSAAQQTTEQTAPSPRQLLASLRENRRQVLELIGAPAIEAAPVPRRRSEFQPTTLMI